MLHPKQERECVCVFSVNSNQDKSVVSLMSGSIYDYTLSLPWMWECLRLMPTHLKTTQHKRMPMPCTL